MAEFEHACFISYKHPPRTGRHFYREFVEALKERLEYYLAANIGTYVDFDADPGSAYPQELSRHLCKSVCLVAVLVPEYADSDWCKAEWKAMEHLEEKRLGTSKGLIIPIVLKRTPAEWEALYKRKPVDFSKVSIPGQLKSATNSDKIKRIADIINNYVGKVPDPCLDCTNFMLAVEEDKLSSPPTFADPDPFN